MGSTAAFTPVQYALNPGMAFMPWISPIAACYTKFKWRGAVVEYIPLASDYASTGVLGFVAAATQYNPLDAPFGDKLTMMNHEFSNEKKISMPLTHPIECAPSQMAIEEYFIRDGPPPPNADLRFYDLGTLTIATGGNPVDTQIGDLWVTFEVEFYQPKIKSDVGTKTDVMTYTNANNSGDNPWGTISDEHNLYGNLFGKWQLTPTDSFGQYYFPVGIQPGTYLLSWQCTGPSTTNAVSTSPFSVVSEDHLFLSTYAGRCNAGALATTTCFTQVIQILKTSYNEDDLKLQTTTTNGFPNTSGSVFITELSNHWFVPRDPIFRKEQEDKRIVLGAKKTDNLAKHGRRHIKIEYSSSSSSESDSSSYEDVDSPDVMTGTKGFFNCDVGVPAKPSIVELVSNWPMIKTLLDKMSINTILEYEQYVEVNLSYAQEDVVKFVNQPTPGVLPGMVIKIPYRQLFGLT